MTHPPRSAICIPSNNNTHCIHGSSSEIRHLYSFQQQHTLYTWVILRCFELVHYIEQKVLEWYIWNNWKLAWSARLFRRRISQINYVYIDVGISRNIKNGTFVGPIHWIASISSTTNVRRCCNTHIKVISSYTQRWAF